MLKPLYGKGKAVPVQLPLWPLNPWVKNPQYPFNMRLSEHQPPSGHSQDEKNLLPLLRIEPQVLCFLAPTVVITPRHLMFIN
jgi:hypothetical protein